MPLRGGAYPVKRSLPIDGLLWDSANKCPGFLPKSPEAPEAQSH